VVENKTAEYTERTEQKPLPRTTVAKRIEKVVDAFDRADRFIAGVAYRRDRAKSLWTTIIGTVWQTAWAVVSFLIGLPRVVWLTVAVIAAALMLLYLYRQLTLGKIRETKTL
jgi:hypothetical protein